MDSDFEKTCMLNFRKGLMYVASLPNVKSYEKWFLDNENVSGKGSPFLEKRMTPKDCFRNATVMALENPDLYYCEGYAFKPSLGIPIHHGWCVTNQGKIVDPTWETPEQCFYIGHKPDKKTYIEWIAVTECPGILGGDHGYARLLLSEFTLKEAVDHLRKLRNGAQEKQVPVR